MSALPIEPFLRPLRGPDLAAEIVAESGRDPADTAMRLDVYLNEVAQGLSMVEPHLRQGQRILEIGAGLGVLAGLLRHGGYDVTGLEPVGGGFGFFAAAAGPVRRRLGADAAPVLPIGVEALDPTRHGRFDLIYSVHVIEHVPDLDRGFAAMAAALAPGGRMVHVCPNYAFPYDPHFSRPMLPGLPSWSRWLMGPGTHLEPGAWESLNFVTAGRIRRLARRHGLAARFAPGLLAQVVDRMVEAARFAERHDVFPASLLLPALRAPRLRRLLAAIPPGLASPMLFALWNGLEPAPDLPF